ncbi:MAG: hypothetical protein WCL60_00645 [Methylococcales bacterium]
MSAIETKNVSSQMMGGTGAMMNEGMSSMMEMGAAASVGLGVGKDTIKKMLIHPLVLFSLGAVVGCCIYKYRKSIISSTKEAQQE